MSGRWIKYFGVGILALTVACTHKPAASSSDNPVDQIPTEKCIDSVCHLQVEGYPQDVAVIIPPYADFKSVTLFLQDTSLGQARDHRLQAVMADFEMVQSVKASHGKRIFIFPFSKGKNDDYRAHFKNKLELQSFFANVYKVLGIKVMVENLQIIAHGQAYETVQNILSDHSKVNENLQISQVSLLDATDPEMKAPVFLQWLKSADNKFTIIYLKGTRTEKKAAQIWSQYSGQQPGKEGGINLEGGDFLTVIPEVEFKGKPDAHWLLARKWFGRVL